METKKTYLESLQMNISSSYFQVVIAKKRKHHLHLQSAQFNSLVHSFLSSIFECS